MDDAPTSGVDVNVVIAHNFYQQPGGEDEVFRAECDLLESHGHRVTRFTMHNDRVQLMGKLAAAGHGVES